MPTYTIEKLEVDDAEEMYELSELCFEGSPLRRGPLFPRERAHLTSPEDLKAYRISRLVKLLQDPQGHCWKAMAQDTDAATSRIVGCAVWHEPNHKDIHERKEILALDPAGPPLEISNPSNEQQATDAPEDEMPACADKELFKTMREAQKNMRKQHLGGDENVWYLAHLMVHPAVQRQGLGKRLLEWGIDAADRDGLPLYLESTPYGQAFYASCGFAKQGYIYGPTYPQDEPYTFTAMKRMPNVRKGPII